VCDFNVACCGADIESQRSNVGAGSFELDVAAQITQSGGAF